MSSYSPSLRKILSDTWRIIAAHPRHFSALSALFLLLPISLAAMLYSFITQPAAHSHYLQSLFTISTPSLPIPQRLTLHIFSPLSILFGICANASITYTAFAAFYNKPVEFISSLKSILVSFFPLLLTQIVSGVIIFGFLLVSGVSAGLMIIVCNMGHKSQYFFVAVMVIAIVTAVVFIYLHVEWCLSTAIVVLESSWGFAPLKRSSYLVKGTRKVAMSMRVLFSAAGGLLSMWYLNVVMNRGGASEGWFCMEMVFYVVLATVLALFSMVANTVLFLYCKASREDLVSAVIDEETGMEYVTLPIKA